MSLIKSKNYLEELARQTLHQVCGFSLEAWYCSDKPDLQNEKENFGIEVVQDVYSNEQEADRFVESIWSKPYSSIEVDAIRRLKKLGVTIVHDNDKIISTSCKSTSSSAEHLIDTICKKIDKLRDGQYRTFERYGLYVFVKSTSIDENFVLPIVDEVIRSAREYISSPAFEVLYLDQKYTLCMPKISSVFVIVVSPIAL